MKKLLNKLFRSRLNKNIVYYYELIFIEKLLHTQRLKEASSYLDFLINKYKESK